MPDELSLIEQIRSQTASQASPPSLIKGIGDDCAVLRPRPKHDLVFTTDFALEGRHFTLDTHKPADIGHKALARSLSDLAAMGSKPLFCLVSLAVPRSLGHQWVKDFYSGLLGLASAHHIALAGGDLASFEKVIADVQCCGEIPAGRSMLRSSARPGDIIYVTGELGASAAGLRTKRGANFRRHLRPEPRITEGRELRRLGVRCCMDLSDGLLLDLHRLCQESNVSADLDGLLPISKGATEEEALSGGEDYELLFTAPPKLRVPGTAIGKVVPPRKRTLQRHGKPIAAKGFNHFS